jgi:Mannosyl-glycoprotein endo-beta-N-acetylglucosaminidase
MLAVLVAVLLTSLAAPVADARLPRAKAYRVGGPITLDTDLLSVSGASAWAIDDYLKATTSLPALGAAFLAAERTYGVNARFLLAAALHESAWGTSYIARVKHNLFGYNAYDRDPVRYATAYATYAANIDDTARFIKDWYLTRGGRWWGGQPTLRSMQQFWSSSGSWGVSVSRVASSIHLASLAGGSMSFAAPVVGGPIHGGDQATVDLAWKGGTIPAGVQFVATWQPVELDSEVVAEASGPAPIVDPGAGDDAPTATPSALPEPAAEASEPAPTTVAARRVHMTARAVRLAVSAPTAPGTYVLDVDMRDSGGGPLPAAQQVDIPSVEVRVWGDRAVSYDLEPDAAGTGAVVRITNMGREAIPAGETRVAASPRVAEAEVVPSIVTITASGSDPRHPGPVVLAETTLAADLPPGSTLTLDVPAIAAVTGREMDWVSVGLTVVGDPEWLAAYPPAGAWFPELGGVSEPAATSSASSTPTPTPSPTPAPTPRPSATPRPTATPSPSATPAPARAPVTTYYQEHSSAIVYRGSWGDAPYARYLGGNVAWSKTPDSTATFSFTGSAVSWIGPAGPTRGLANVLLDGKVVARVSMWRSSFVAQAVLFKHSFDGIGPHTLTIQVLSMPSHPYVAIDAFTVVH